MAKRKYILMLVAVLSAVTVARAQFSLSTAEQSANLQMPMSIRIDRPSVDVTNRFKAQAIRKAIWRERNQVDVKVSFTGIVTEYNKSWTNNNQNSVSGELNAYYYHTYRRGRVTSEFKFDGNYGMNLIDEVWFKHQDNLKLYHRASWSVKQSGILKNWAYSFQTTFASQFSEGFKGRGAADRHIPWSNFMAPGTVNASLGFTYTSPNSKLPFIVTMGVISGDAFFVLDDRIDDARRVNLGIPVARDSDGNPINHKFQGGSKLNVSFNRTFVFGKKKGISLQYNTTLDSFYGWITQVSRHDPVGDAAPLPEIMPTLNWTNTITFNPLKYLGLEFRTVMKYDKSQIDKVQMQYYLRVALTYRYLNKEIK